MYIDHINISAPMELLKEVKTFYCEVFNLTEGFRPGFIKNGYWLYEGEQAIIHLSESQVHNRHETPAHLDHVAFRVTDLQPITDMLDKLNIKYNHIYSDETKMTQLFFKDPSGTKLEVNFIDE